MWFYNALRCILTAQLYIKTRRSSFFCELKMLVIDLLYISYSERGGELSARTFPETRYLRTNATSPACQYVGLERYRARTVVAHMPHHMQGGNDCSGEATILTCMSPSPDQPESILPVAPHNIDCCIISHHMLIIIITLPYPVECST
jgi:hypothetical protein